MDIKRLIDGVEKLFLVVIAGFTVIGMGQEILLLYENRHVALKDLLLMFIYAEVLGMLGAFYTRQRNLITLPLFIAITALSRLIILQGKDSDPIVLLYEAAAILLITVSCWVVSQMRAED
jgi:protein PsiE